MVEIMKSAGHSSVQNLANSSVWKSFKSSLSLFSIHYKVHFRSILGRLSCTAFDHYSVYNQQRR